MAIRGEIPKHPGQRGSWVELEFMSRATFERLLVSVPWGQQRWDVSVEYRKCRFRMQIKSALRSHRGTHQYGFRLTGGGNRPYTPSQIDYLALYVIDMDLWYIIPARKLRVGNKYARYIHITPGGRTWSRWHPYEERWDLLRGAKSAPVTRKKAAPKKNKKKNKKKSKNRNSTTRAASGPGTGKQFSTSRARQSNSRRGKK